jgi:tetratricopeptide (TPR) repeat protein
LTAYQGVLTGKLRFIFPSSLARGLMRRLGVQEGIAAYYYREAHRCANSRDYDGAIRACRASIAVRPENVVAYEVLAQVLTHVQRYEQALQACADALAAKPDSDAISASLRQLLPLVSQSQQPQRIIAILKKCLVVSAARGDVLACLIEMLTRSNRYPELLQACQGILEIDPEFFPAVETIRSLQNNPAAKKALANVTVPATPSLSEEYDWLVASNVTDALIEILSKFYAMAGVDPQTAPLVQGLERSRRKLVAVRPQMEPVSDQSTLVFFELAWKSYCAGQTKKALAAFEKIFSDNKLHQRGAFNPFVKEAVVRAGEMLGRHYDTLGDVEKAIGIYREVLSVDSNSLIARRLIVLLSRSGRLYQAVEFAETAIASGPNLFRNIPPNQHIAALKAELYLKPEGA